MKTNILFLIIGFLAGFGVAMPLWVYFGKKSVMFIAQTIGGVALREIFEPVIRQNETLNRTARIEFSKIGAGISESAAGTFKYLSTLINKESIESAYELQDDSVNSTRKWAADLIELRRDAESSGVNNKSLTNEPLTFEWLEKEKLKTERADSPIGNCGDCGIFSAINYFTNPESKPICGYCNDKPEISAAKIGGVSSASDTRKVDEMIILSGDDAAFNLSFFENTTRIGVFKTDVEYAIDSALIENDGKNFYLPNLEIGRIFCYVVYAINISLPKADFVFIPIDNTFDSHIRLEQIGAHLSRELRTSGVLESLDAETKQ